MSSGTLSSQALAGASEVGPWPDRTPASRRAGPARSPQPRTAALLVSSLPYCLMSAFAATLGMFNLLIVSSGVSFTFLTVLPPGWGSQLSRPGAGCFSSSRSCLPSGWPAQGDGASPSACRPRGAHLPGSRLAELNTLNEAAVGCGGKSRSVCCFGRDVSPGAHGRGWGLLPRGPPGVRTAHTHSPSQGAADSG